MKKMFLMIFAAMILVSVLPVSTEASTNTLSFKSIVFESTSEKDEYYALKFFDYLFELESIDATKNKMTHLQFSNDEYYKFFDYLFGIADIPDFQDGLRNVIATYEAQNLNVFPAKVEGGIVVSNGTQVAPPEFKVVDIK